MFYVVLLCLFFPALEAISITLRTQNNSLSQPAQQPFRIVVEVNKGDRNTGNVVLDGMHQLQVLGQQRSNNVVMVNGSFSSTITYYFTVVAPSPGTLTIGPAKVHHQGKDLASNTLTLTITPPAQTQQAQTSSGQQSRSTKLSANKNEVVLGEPIEVSLTFVAAQPVIEAATGKLEAPGFEVKEPTQWLARQEMINGTPHHIIEKKYLLTPHKEGSFNLGPLPFEALIPAQRTRRSQGNIFDDDFFADFFGQQTERVQTQSNALQINVKALPADQRCDGVGTFTSYQAALSATQAYTHEPLTLTLDLEGAGNLEQITIPKLVLPKGIKYYESKNETIAPDGPGAGKKHFEFVLQATTPGMFVIPQQEFAFFNTSSRQINTLCSNELSVTIQGSAKSAPLSTETNPPPAPAQTPAEQSNQPQPQQPAAPPAALPWWVFAAILLIPVPFFARPIIAAIRRISQQLRAQKQRTKGHYEKTFKTLIKKQDLDGLYAFFMAYIAQQNNVASAELSMDDVEAYLTRRGFDYEKTDEFMSFLGSCSGGKYAHKSTLATQEKDALLDKAQYWFLMLL